MQHTRARWAQAVLFAVVVALGGASPALAASTSGGVSETYTIAASVTVANVPSTGTFASPPACVPSGCLASDFAYLFTTTVGTNNGSGLTLDVMATALTSGSSTIPVSSRGVSYGTAPGFARVGAAGPNIGVLSPTTGYTLGSTSAQGSVDIVVEPILRVNPNAFPAGNYSGTFTVRATTNP